jgi:hypothetical protein
MPAHRTSEYLRRMKVTVPSGLSYRIGMGLPIGLPCSSKPMGPLAPAHEGGLVDPEQSLEQCSPGYRAAYGPLPAGAHAFPRAVGRLGVATVP